MTIPAHVSSPPKATKAQEEVEVGDAVQIPDKNKPGPDKTSEVAVISKRGPHVRCMYENKVDTRWVDSTELIKIIKGGAEELMQRAEKAAQAAAEAAAKKKAEEEAKAAEKAAAEAKEAARKAEERRIYELYKKRAMPAFDWCPTGKYFNLDHLPIPDHQKDIFRIVAYTLDVDKEYKRSGPPKYQPDNDACGARVFFTDGTVTPMNFGMLKPEEQWTEDEKEFKGGSKDKGVKGDGSAFLLQKQLADDAESDPWACKILHFKEAFDGGKTLAKYDFFPSEDPCDDWTEIDNETMKGWVRKSEEGNWDW